MLKITIAAARVNKGLKQGEVAETLGVAVSTLRNWEKGKTFPSAALFTKLCELYGVTTDDIFLG